MEREKVAVYGDLTSLYSARSKYHKTINYERLNTVLRSIAKLKPTESFSDNSFYTVYSGQNEGQVSFVKSLKNLGWNIETISPKHIRYGKGPDFRFDTDISYDIACSVDSFEKMIIVSDSFELARSIERFQQDDSVCEISLVFFSQALDSRWWPIVRDPESVIKFIDLDVELG